jgi:small subunit ribosomal protein S4
MFIQEVPMAHTHTAKGKIVRRLGTNIYGQVKFDRLLQKKPQAPGRDPDDRRRRKITDYGRQLAEKQKLRFGYGLSEKQFRNLYRRAKAAGGVTSDTFIQLLERRLDNLVYRFGWAASRDQARQLVSHNHLLVNGQPLNIPSALLTTGDRITVKRRKGVESLIRSNLAAGNRVRASWVTVEEDSLSGVLTAIPDAAEVPIDANVQLVVEYYSRS